MLSSQEYRNWLAVAKRHACRAGEAEDLLHDSLLSAVEAGHTNLDDPRSRAWFAGIIRNKAKMDARTATRRRRRETSSRRSAPIPNAPTDDPTLKLVRSLPPATRALATLTLHGMTREEIAFVLDLTAAALRQRLATLRRRWREMPAEIQEQAIMHVRRRARTIGREMELGLMRRALLALVREVPGVGTHDPDGHLIMIEKSTPSRFGISRQH